MKKKLLHSLRAPLYESDDFPIEIHVTRANKVLGIFGAYFFFPDEDPPLLYNAVVEAANLLPCAFDDIAACEVVVVLGGKELYRFRFNTKTYNMQLLQKCESTN